MIQRKAHGSTENQRKLTRGLIIGRFQPFHKGHLDLVYQVLEEINELIIVIGSSQHNYIFKDPFTAGERLVMIHDTLVQEKIDLKACWEKVREKNKNITAKQVAELLFKKNTLVLKGVQARMQQT